MLSIRVIRDGQVTRVGREAVAAALAERERGAFVWIDLAAPDAEEDLLLELPELGLDALAIEDMREDLHLPKLDLYSDHLLLTVHAIEIEMSTVELTTIELDVALAPGLLITYHPLRIATVDAVAELLDAGAPELHTPVLLLHRILDVMNDVFVPFLDLMGSRLDLVEEDVLERPTAVTRSEIFALRRDLITLRRTSVPQAEVIRRLGRDPTDLISREERHYFRDVYDHLYRMAEMSEVYRQLVESAYDMYRSVREDETNRRLTVLTMVSTTLLPISVLAGIYGMNFAYMPELERRWAYPALWGGCGLVVVGSLLLFRAWGWIGRGAADEDAARRRRLVERLELPSVGRVLRIPAYGARFAASGGKRVARIGRRLGPGRRAG